MSKTLETRVTKLEAQAGGGGRFPPGPFIYREGETRSETLARYGLTPDDIEGRFTVWLPDNGRGDGPDETG